MKIQKLWPNDGSKRAGMPYGKILTVTKIENHTPCDGPTSQDAILWLDDNTWVFEWNIKIIEK